MDTTSNKRRPTLSWQLFFSIGILFLFFAGCFLVYQSRRERLFKIALLNQQLQDYNAHLGEALQYRPLEDDSLNEYIASHPVPSLRITLLDPHGYVLYDNKTDAYPDMEDHRGRKEILEAISKGSSYVLDRVSSTADDAYFYSATFFPEQNLIIRSALPYDDELPRILRADTTFLWFALALITLLAGLLYWFSKRTGDQVDRNQEKASFALQKELTQNISHELKTPIAEIRAYLETLQDHADMPEETRARFLLRSNALARRLSALVEDLSTLDTMDAGKMAQPFEEVDLAEIIRQVTLETEDALTGKGMTLALSIPESIPLNGNPKLLYGIFRNLTDNALLYAGEGAEISLRAWRDGKRWHFVFADNGNGVPEASLPKLYERFYRTDKGRSRKLGGTGLGLAIVKDAILLHGGDIRASANTPHGLKHEFWIPDEG